MSGPLEKISSWVLVVASVLAVVLIVTQYFLARRVNNIEIESMRANNIGVIRK